MFYWMFLSSNKEINFYLNVTIAKKGRAQFSMFKLFVSRSDFGEIQLRQMSMNFRTYCCNLKIRGLGAKLRATFL